MPSILKTTSSLLSRLWNRQLLVFFIFLILSAAFWVFTALKEVKEKEFDVAFTVEGIPANVVITTEPPRHITVTLRDEVSTLLQYYYRRNKMRVSVNWRDVETSSGHVRLQTDALLKPFLMGLHSTTEVVGHRPETVEFYYNYGLKKTVDVILQGVIEADSTFTITGCDLSHRRVNVYGSRAMLDTVTGAYLRPLNKRGLTEKTTFPAEFQKVKGLKYDPDKITVTAYVDRMMEKTVQVDVKGINFPAGKLLRTFPPKVSITYQVGTSLDKQISADDFTLVVNYLDLIDKTDNRIGLALKSTPAGVQRARLSPAEVEFIIEENNEASE